MRKSKSGRIVISHKFNELIDFLNIIYKVVKRVFVVIKTNEGGNHNTMTKS